MPPEKRSSSVPRSSPYASTSSAASQQVDLIPTDYQAIFIEGCLLKDYTAFLKKHVPPSDILYVSSIPEKGICFYLKSAELAKDVVTRIDGLPLTELDPSKKICARLLRPTQKVIIFTQPTVPTTDIVEKILRPRHLVPISEIRPVNAGFSDNDCKHILSFDREFLIDYHDKSKLPIMEEIAIGTNNYWVDVVCPVKID